MVSGPGGHDHDSQHQLFLILETPRYFQKSKKKPKSFSRIFVIGNLNFSEIETFKKIGKDGHRQIMKIRLLFFENPGYGISIFQKT